LLTFFGKTKKVSRPRQGVKQQQTTKARPRQGVKQQNEPQTSKPEAQTPNHDPLTLKFDTPDIE
jgi:hypothetical protein